MADTTVEGMAALTASVTTLATEKGTLVAELAASKGIVTTLEATVAARDATIATLQAAVTAAAGATALTADHGVMLAFLQASSLKAQIAAGKTDPKAGATVAELVAEIETGGTHLALALAAGARAVAAATDNKSKDEAPSRADSAAFRAK